MLAYLIVKKDDIRYRLEKYYYRYGLFCSTHPIFMILLSGIVIIACSLPLTSFPIFEKTIAFLFQRIRVEYDTTVSRVTPKSSAADEVLAYVLQVHFNVSLNPPSELSDQHLLQNIMQAPYFQKLEKQLRYPTGVWNSTCLKLHRDPPSMKALKKRIKFPRGSIHEDLKMRTFYNLQCLFLAPLFLFDDGSGILANDLSTAFKELAVGYPIHPRVFDSVEGDKQHISFVFTFFLQRPDPKFQSFLLDDLKSFDGMIEVKVKDEIGNKIKFKFSDESGPAELIPFTIAYVIAFFYLWFSVAKLDLIRTRWGLAFSAVVNCCFSFIMAMGICAIFDVLPSTLNVGEIFPYVFILIGIENFWIITKSVMTSKKDLNVKERVAIGLGKEGWYITKNLVVEFSLLFAVYMTGIKGFKEYSIFALACYLSDFFLQMTFFTPILAVDIRRAEVGLPFTDSSAWRYALCIEIERPEVTSKAREQEEPTAGFSAAVKIAFHIARYRIIQRGLMVFMVIYFSFVFVTLPIQEIVNPVTLKDDPYDARFFNISEGSLRSCLTAAESARRGSDVASWRTLCRKHWPELFNYYFIHLDNKSLQILPQIDVMMAIDPLSLERPPHPSNLFVDRFVSYVSETSKTMATLSCMLMLTLLYKVGTIVHAYIGKLRKNADFYACAHSTLVVPGNNERLQLYKVTKMVVDETDTLVCSFTNGSVYVWDLFYSSCNYCIDRRTKMVRVLSITRSQSATSLPAPESVVLQQQAEMEIPLCVWSLGYKSEVLVVGCEAGAIEVYSVERDAEMLLCEYQGENQTGIVSVKVLSCLRFVVAYQNGVVEFFHLKAKPAEPGSTRSSSLPLMSNQSRCDICVSRSVSLFNQDIQFMEMAVDKIYVTSVSSQVKVLRASDDGGIPLPSNISRDVEVSVIKTELSPETALVGTCNGYVYVLDSFGQVTKTLCCGVEEVMSVASDDDYIAALAFDGVLTVWLKEGYIKWWQVNLITYGGAYEILPLARYSLAAVSKDFVILLNIITRNIINVVPYEVSPLAGLIMALPLVCQDKSSIVVSCGTSLVHLKFPKLVDHKR